MTQELETVNASKASRDPDVLIYALIDAWQIMNYMGEILNGMDACEPEDEDIARPRFESVRRALGIEETK